MIDPIRPGSVEYPSSQKDLVSLAAHLETQLLAFEQALRNVKMHPQLSQDAEFVKSFSEHVKSLSHASQKALEV